ncbi:hypothetical protein RHMOL_Rhmol11G0083800 [Rhododendron molle]|uniref:Uncharacterized protein n=1 Tax=Rhododendron molle TaxID=49168 RepID=A0ACC0LQW2_RHOML|nr:hypothetical protein RHMOL_Rhmol11G0083800 [Rhododendron molle]
MPTNSSFLNYGLSGYSVNTGTSNMSPLFEIGAAASPMASPGIDSRMLGGGCPFGSNVSPGASESPHFNRIGTRLVLMRKIASHNLFWKSLRAIKLSVLNFLKLQVMSLSSVFRAWNWHPRRELILSLLMYGFQVLQKKALEDSALAFCIQFIKAMASLDTDVKMVPAGEGPSDAPPSFAAASTSLSSMKAKLFKIKKWNAVTLWAWDEVIEEGLWETDDEEEVDVEGIEGYKSESSDDDDEIEDEVLGSENDD